MDLSSPTPDGSTLRKVFISPEEPRLRAGWRILAHSAVYNLLLFSVAIPVYVPALLLGVSPDNLWLSVALQLVSITPTVFLARRFLDHRSISSLGLKFNRLTVFDLLTGIGITFFMMGLIFAIEFATGWLTFEGFTWQTESVSTVALSMLGMIVLFVLVGWNEELLFRGYRLQNMLDGLSPIWAILISSAWFGMVHLANPNATFVSAIGILLAGIFLAYPLLRTGQLWLSIGLHIGWNLFEGPVFGFPVSGLSPFTLIRISVQGPSLITGGTFGPEAGLVILPALLIGLALIFIYTRDRLKPAVFQP
jgi:uncharacterized protein